MSDHADCERTIAELRAYVDTLVAASVACHRILETPQHTTLLTTRCEDVMYELHLLRAKEKLLYR